MNNGDVSYASSVMPAGSFTCSMAAWLQAVASSPVTTAPPMRLGIVSVFAFPRYSSRVAVPFSTVYSHSDSGRTFGKTCSPFQYIASTSPPQWASLAGWTPIWIPMISPPFIKGQIAGKVACFCATAAKVFVESLDKSWEVVYNKITNIFFERGRFL